MKKAASLLVLAALAASVPFAACGGDKPTPNAPTADTGSASAAASAAASGAASVAPGASAAASATASAAPAKPTWKTMSKDERKEHMKSVVVPKMAAVFQGADAKKYAKLDCTTCHGPGAKDGKFDMPNAKLPKLVMGDPAKPFAKHKPEMVKFMREKVMPEMAAALDAQPYDPATKAGFGCGGCHVMSEK